MREIVISYIVATIFCYFPTPIILNHIVRFMTMCKLWFSSIFDPKLMIYSLNRCASHPLIKLTIFHTNFWNSSPTTFLCLPDEIVSEIFTRLSPDQLALVKGVCKRWHSLTTHPDFVNLHLVRSRLPQQQLLMFPNYEPDDKVLLINMQHKEHMHFEILNLNFPFHRKFSVQASCDGLLLLVDHNEVRHINKELYVYNPATTKYLRLPDLESIASFWTFFYDNDMGKYRVFATILQYRCEHVLLTVGEDSWRWLPSNGMAQTPAIYLKNKLHWVTKEYHRLVANWFIRSMDVANMEYVDTATPEFGNPIQTFLSEVGGSLCLTALSHNELELDVFVLESFSHGRWTKKYTVNIYSLKNLPVFVTSFMHENIFLFAMRDVGNCDFSDVMKIFIYDGDGDKLKFYDLKSQELREVGPISARQFDLDFWYCMFYSSTLVGV